MKWSIDYVDVVTQRYQVIELVGKPAHANIYTKDSRGVGGIYFHLPGA